MSYMTPNSPNLQSTLHNILKDTGKLIMGYRSKFGAVADKQKNEIVTPADIASNQFIISQLQKNFSNIPIYSEEDNYKSQSSTRWIIDPLDGTTPWVWGIAGFSISVALESKGIVTVGAVYDPVFDEFFFAKKDEGATKNNTPIHTITGVNQKDMLIVADWGNKDGVREEGVAIFSHFFIPDMFARRIVPQFAPALGLCKIAEGRIQALLCNDTWTEDHAAGALILQEAGGYVSNFRDTTKEFNHREFGIIATNEKSTHQLIVNFLKQSKVNIK